MEYFRGWSLYTILYFLELSFGNIAKDRLFYIAKRSLDSILKLDVKISFCAGIKDKKSKDELQSPFDLLQKHVICFVYVKLFD